MRRIWKNPIYDVYCISQYLYQRYTKKAFLGVISIAQLVEVTDSAVLGGVAEVVSSNPTVGHKNIFQHLPAVDLLFLSLSLFLSLFLYLSLSL